MLESVEHRPCSTYHGNVSPTQYTIIYSTYNIYSGGRRALQATGAADVHPCVCREERPDATAPPRVRSDEQTYKDGLHNGKKSLKPEFHFLLRY